MMFPSSSYPVMFQSLPSLILPTHFDPSGIIHVPCPFCRLFFHSPTYFWHTDTPFQKKLESLPYVVSREVFTLYEVKKVRVSIITYQDWDWIIYYRNWNPKWFIKINFSLVNVVFNQIINQMVFLAAWECKAIRYKIRAVFWE